MRPLLFGPASFRLLMRNCACAGCALHPRSRVQIAQRNAHTSIQVQRKHSGIPRAMALRLTSCSCVRKIWQDVRTGGSDQPPVAAGLMAVSIRSDRSRHRQLGTSNRCRDHTVLPYANSAVRPARRCSLTEKRPANHTRADAAASTASSPAFVTIAIRPSCRERTGRAGSADLPDTLSEIFFAGGLDSD